MTDRVTREGAGAEESDVLSAAARKHFIRIKVVVDTKQPGVEGHPIALMYLDAEIRAAEAAATAKERERCARLAKESRFEDGPSGTIEGQIARAILVGEQDGAPQDEQ
jgi:hypothetical protein